MPSTKAYVVEEGPYGLTWPDRHILIQPGTFNISIPRHTTDGTEPSYMLGASSDIKAALAHVNRAYVSDTGLLTPELPSNITGKRIAFVHDPITADTPVVKVRVVTGKYWDELIEEMWFKHYKDVVIRTSHTREQMRITRRSDDNPPMGPSELRILATGTMGDILVTGRNTVTKHHVNSREDVKDQVARAVNGYDNFIEFDTYQQMLIARQSLTVNSTLFCKNTNGDDSTHGGNALYSYIVDTDTLTKIFESESMDVEWALSSIPDAPATTEEFDGIVFDSHTHSDTSLLAMNALSINNDTGNIVANNIELNNGIEALVIDW